MKRKFKFYAAVLFSFVMFFSFESCNKSQFSNNRNVSSATVLAINNKKGGFQYNTNYKCLMPCNAYGINELVLKEKSITESILNTAGVSLPIKLMDIQSKGTSVWSIKIPAGSSIIGKDISKLKFPFRAIILGKIDNKGNPFQSTENIDIEQDDTVLIISSNRNEESMTRFFQGKDNG